MAKNVKGDEKIMKKIIITFISLLILTGCSSDAKITKINGIKAKELIKSEAVLIDVRTLAEYNAEHLDGALNIAVDVIADKIESEVPDKDTKIIVYCRSGNRSNMAAEELLSLGYKNIYDLGSMDNY